MIAAGRGKIIQSSRRFAGLGGAMPEVLDSIAYNTSKGRTRQLQDATSRSSGAGTQINVNADRAGMVPEQDVERDRRALGRPAFARTIPLAGSAATEDLKGTIVYLASRASDYITGQILAVERRAHRLMSVARRRWRPRPSWSSCAMRSSRFFGADIAMEQLALLAGGASKEAWALDLRTPQGTRQLLVRRAGGGVIHQETLTLEEEPPADGRVRGRRACAEAVWLSRGDRGSTAFVSERVSGETIGAADRAAAGARRCARGAAGADREELAKIHAIPSERVPFSAASSTRCPRPSHDRARPPRRRAPGDRARPRLGATNGRRSGAKRSSSMVTSGSETSRSPRRAWSRARLGVRAPRRPAEDVAWPLVRAWRFGVDQPAPRRIGDVEPYLERYNARHRPAHHARIARLLGDRWPI